MNHGIYLIVQFSFPSSFDPEYGERAKQLHAAVQEPDWIEEVLAASGGLGAGPAAIWVFKMADYASLDVLFGGEDEVSEAYLGFFGRMDGVQDSIREQVIFLED